MKNLFKRRRFLSLFIITALIISSCTQETETLSTENNQIPELRAGGDNQFDLLGYGYDATKKFAHPTSKKGMILDLTKFKSKYPERVDIDLSPLSSALTVSGESSVTYIAEMNKKITADVTISKLGLNLFSGSVSQTYDSKSLYSSDYSFASSDIKFPQKTVAIYARPADIIDCLTASFKTDLATMPASYIINTYGTHILTNITLGAKINFIYRSKVVNSDKKTTVTSGLTASVRQIFKTSLNTTEYTSQVQNNKEQYLFYEVTGGKPIIIPAELINYEADKAVRDISTWQKGIDKTNMAMIDINANGLLPIYELVTDPVKKKNLEVAFTDYIKNSQLVVEQTERFPDVLFSGQGLRKGQSLQSANGLYKLNFQADGNVVLYDVYYKRVIWSTNTVRSDVDEFVMQTDGNLVVYSHDSKGKNTARWASHSTNKAKGGKLILQDDGNLVIYVGNSAKWATNTYR